MVAIDSLDLDLVLIFGVVVLTGLIAKRTHLPITALEIFAGILLVAFLSFQLPDGTDSILTLGSLLIVFLAGLETGGDFLRTNLRRALVMGLGGFLVPFAGLLVLLIEVVHAPTFIALIGATVLADTSISITYTTVQQYDLANLPFGRLLLASTLCVNLAEDATITTGSALTTPGLGFTLAVLGCLAACALALPRVVRLAEGASTDFTNLGGRGLLFSLAVMALLSSLVGVPGILFVFLMGLYFSKYFGREFLANVQSLAFAVFIPLYFLGVGLKVDPGFVLANGPLLLALVGVATVLKVASVYPLSRRIFGAARAAPVTAVMNARLTSATVILLLMLTYGEISADWYSIFLSAVLILALGSAAALRGLPAYRSPATAKSVFEGEIPNEGGSKTERGASDRLPSPI